MGIVKVIFTITEIIKNPFIQVSYVNTILIIMNNNLNVTKMQQTLKTIVPTPQNISKWSMGRKEIKAKNQYLLNQLDLKRNEINNLKKEVNELNCKLKFNGLKFNTDFRKTIDIDFDFHLRNSDSENLTYYVTSDQVNYRNEIEIPIDEIIEHFGNRTITQNELDSFISEYLNDYLSY